VDDPLLKLEKLLADDPDESELAEDAELAELILLADEAELKLLNELDSSVGSDCRKNCQMCNMTLAS
jgi:hypothetical protein